MFDQNVLVRIVRRYYSMLVGLPALAYDVDGTVADTDGIFIKLMRRIMGSRPEGIPLEHFEERIKRRDTVEVTDFKTKKCQKQFLEVCHSKEMLTGRPIRGAPEVFRRIDREIVPLMGPITGRNERYLKETVEWLEQYRFPFQFAFMRPKRVKNARRHAHKIRLLTKLGRQVLGIIEDDPKIAQKHILNGYKGTIWLLWTEHSDDQRVIPCPNLEALEADMRQRFAYLRA